MMRLLAELEAEHALIDRALGSLRAYVATRLRGDGDPADGAKFIGFFRQYAGDFHHGREEDTLFAALIEKAHLPPTGPIATLLEDHCRLAGLLLAIEPLIGLGSFDAQSGERLDDLARAYSAALWHHIDAENSVLLPESDARLRKKGIAELPSRDLTEAERRAMEDGEALIRRYIPIDDPGVNRGDGCVCCPAFVDGCGGIEREWWNEWEWAEFEDHLGAD